VSSRFFAIDFDRCLSNTDALFDIFYDVVDEHAELDREQLVRARKSIEDNGGSFDQISALRALLSQTALKEFIDTFITRSQANDVLSKGSRELMQSLEDKDVPFGIISYGNEDWQKVKIQASGIASLPVLITPHSRKGEIISTWQQESGLFKIPQELTSSGSLEVETVVLLDDKAVAFNNLPLNAKGYWVKSASKQLLPSQLGEIPANVSEVFSLRDVIEREAL
jgi:hypothetical protein